MKVAKRVLLQSTILYVLVYLIYSFIVWDIQNPLQWIINIPNMEKGDRAGLLTSILMYWGISIFVHWSIINESKNK